MGVVPESPRRRGVNVKCIEFHRHSVEECESMCQKKRIGGRKTVTEKERQRQRDVIYGTHTHNNCFCIP